MSGRDFAQGDLSLYTLWYGRDEPPPQDCVLRAGPLAALWEAPDLRRIRVGNVELVRRVYVSVRDENWDTIPVQIKNLSTNIEEDYFVISYDGENCSRNLEFHWHATIRGEKNGAITFRMDGQTPRSFSYNRIGFCILHPLSEYCGQPFSGHGPGGPVSGNLPTLIDPVRFEGGFYLPPFPSVSHLVFSLKSGIELHCAFEGDLFEMEDQRNWTDGSLKTYCTPLALGFPHKARAGQSFMQEVTFTVKGHAAQGIVTDSKVQINLGPSLQRPLPRIGLSVASHEVDLSANDADLLGGLHLDHLRADLHLSEPASAQQLTRAERECGLLRCSAELALYVTDDADAELCSLASHFPLSVPVSRVLVFHERETTTAAKWIESTRRALAPRLPNVQICGGTDLDFAELNRLRPDVANFDAVAYAMNPQVHAFDERSLVENLEAQRDTVITAQAFCGNRAIVVSPITLKPRFNPDAVGPEAPPLPGELPRAVDARQMSLFAAAWTVGSIKQLAEAGASSLTFYETTGWRGVKETDEGCSIPRVFRSFPGMVFPVYHVIADLADFKNAELLTCNSFDPLRVDGFALKKDGRLRILLANLTPEPQDCNLTPLAADRVAVRSLDGGSALLATTEPKKFRSGAKQVESFIADPRLTLTLQPYSVVKIDSVCAL